MQEKTFWPDYAEKTPEHLIEMLSKLRWKLLLTRCIIYQSLEAAKIDEGNSR